MTLRQALGDDAARLHELLETLLDREDVVILLFDGDRAVNYIGGFGLSPSQHELLALGIEQVMRAAGATAAPKRTRERDEREKSSSSGRGPRAEHDADEGVDKAA